MTSPRAPTRLRRARAPPAPPAGPRAPSASRAPGARIPRPRARPHAPQPPHPARARTRRNPRIPRAPARAATPRPWADGTARLRSADDRAPEDLGDEPVASVVGVLVRATRPGDAHPGQRADRGDVRRCGPHGPESARSGDRVREVVAPEGGEHIGDARSVPVVPDGKQLVDPGREALGEDGNYLAVPAISPKTQLRYVVGHPDHQHPAASR